MHECYFTTMAPVLSTVPKILLLITLVNSLSTTQNAILHNLNAIVSHIQNPQLYSPQWANQMEFHETTNQPIAQCDIHPGELITLYPIQSIFIEQKNETKKGASSSFAKEDSTRVVNLLQEERYPYPHLRNHANNDDDTPLRLCIHAARDIRYTDGWYGNLIPNNETMTRRNCLFVPLPSVAPLCGIVATRWIAKGEAILGSSSSDDDNDDDELYRITNKIAKTYAEELGDLLPYLQMAYTTNMPANENKKKEKQTKLVYHNIDTSYPGLQKVHSHPDIYTIPDFFTTEECQRLIEKARCGLRPCLVKNEDTGRVEPDPSRTSKNANIPRAEVPSLTRKLLQLGNCLEEQLETFQVLQYEAGQEFQRHTDGFANGPTTACGFQDSGRIATIFCYLNDVVGSGGTTLFTKLRGVDIQPKRGMAVIHFPMSLDLVEDERTEHQGSVVIGDDAEKWILTAWIWKHWMADYRYAEENLESLSDDII